MQIVKLNRQGSALRVTIPAGYARQLALTARDHVYVEVTGYASLRLWKVPRALRARSVQGEPE